VIVWHKGLLDGWNREARRETIAWQIGGGQYWHENYDPYDPFTLTDSQAVPPTPLRHEIEQGRATPILVVQGTWYPGLRMQSVLIKGIDPAQDILALPAGKLRGEGQAVPAMIGGRAAKRAGLRVGDRVTVRWRDAHGAFDAADMEVVHVFRSSVPAVDNGQVWVPLERLRAMMDMPGRATLAVAARDAGGGKVSGWPFKGHDFLLSDLDRMIAQKSAGGAILYVILLLLAVLAIFDTQVLSIFRRHREIGTLVALGMTRWQVVRLFTVEGAMHGVLAALVAAAYGAPLLWLQATRGFSMPEATDDYGFAAAERLFPVYSVGLVLGTTCLVLVTTTIVSFLPASRIARMKPTDAIRGKVR
jgi:ABC-type lipoprotein release transport system permease subunit